MNGKEKNKPKRKAMNEIVAAELKLHTRNENHRITKLESKWNVFLSKYGIFCGSSEAYVCVLYIFFLYNVCVVISTKYIFLKSLLNKSTLKIERILAGKLSVQQ